jgi:MFS family permease
VHLGVAAGVLLLGGLVLGPSLPSAAPRPTGPSRTRGRGGWSLTLVRLGLTGAVLMICEGAALGWSAIFLHDSKGASLGLAATAVTAYTGGQAFGRIVGDRLTSSHGHARVFRAGGLISVGGLAVGVLAPAPVVAIAGFAVAGLGASVLIPLVFSAVGRVDPSGANTAALVSRFATFTYAGILLGPAAIGAVADLAGLTVTLAALAPLLLGAVLTSPLLSAGDREFQSAKA